MKINNNILHYYYYNNRSKCIFKKNCKTQTTTFNLNYIKLKEVQISWSCQIQLNQILNYLSVILFDALHYTSY